MSTRTLIEVNHDFLADMERDPRAAVAQIVALCCDRDRARSGGVTGLSFVASGHHSEPYSVNYPNRRVAAGNEGNL